MVISAKMIAMLPCVSSLNRRIVSTVLLIKFVFVIITHPGFGRTWPKGSGLHIARTG